jgi:hypothetical protein
VNVCSRCKDERVTQDTLFLCGLIYPEAAAGVTREEQKTSFTQVCCRFFLLFSAENGC